MARVESMPRAAIATPYLPVHEKGRIAAEAMGVARVSYWEASLNEMQTVTARARTG